MSISLLYVGKRMQLLIPTKMQIGLQVTFTLLRISHPWTKGLQTTTTDTNKGLTDAHT